jgi:hypothetical protein
MPDRERGRQCGRLCRPWALVRPHPNIGWGNVHGLRASTGLVSAMGDSALDTAAAPACSGVDPRLGSLPPGLARDTRRFDRRRGVDGEDPARVGRAVEACNSGLRGVAVSHRHGATALRAARMPVDRDVDHAHRSIGGEELAEVMRRHTGRQITHNNVHTSPFWGESRATSTRSSAQDGSAHDRSAKPTTRRRPVLP